MSRRKPEAIDIVQLFVGGNTGMWNAILTSKYRKRDLNGLIELRRRLQRGMEVAAKQKMNTQKICVFFLRLQGSIEKTMKRIVREQQPNPCDNPLIAMDNLEHKGKKKQRDNDFERMLHKTGY